MNEREEATPASPEEQSGGRSRAPQLPPFLDTLFVLKPAALLLVVGEKARRSGWAAETAVSLSRTWASRGRRVLLADLSIAQPELHELVGVPNEEGISDVLLYGASLARVARALEPATFRFVPAGATAAGTEDILEDVRWERLIAGCGRAGATLVVYVPADAPGLDALAGRVGRAVVLAEADEAAGARALLPPSCSVVGVFGPPEAVDGPPPAADALPEAPQPERWLEIPPPIPIREPRRPRRFSPLVAASLIPIALAGWFAARYLLRSRGVEFERREAAAAVPSATSAAPAVRPPDARPVETPLPYSVTVEAHQDVRLAAERVSWLSGIEPDVEFFTVPLLVDSVVYHYVMAGAVEDSSAAVAILDRLIEDGHRTGLEPRAVRESSLAFNLGDFDTRAAAERRRRELGQVGVATYIVEIGYSAGPPRFRIYAGAYRGPGEAEVMKQLLASAGVSAPLGPRTGRSEK